MSSLVVSYPNPDTDGVACVLSVAKYYDFLPVMQGRISPETEYVLERLALAPPKRLDRMADAESIVLVDTHHLSQIGPAFPADKVIKVIDHHPGGDEQAFYNAQIDNRKIGAAASIVGEMYLQRGDIEKNICKLLQYAIVSNTLNFTAPATSEFDRNIFNRLNALYSVSNHELNEMLHHRKSDDVMADTKYFSFGKGRIAIAQVEEYGLRITVDEVKKALHTLDKRDELLFSIWNGVDIESGKSTVVFSDGLSDAEAIRLFSYDVRDGVYRTDRILLRKTDFIPALIRYQDQTESMAQSEKCC